MTSPRTKEKRELIISWIKHELEYTDASTHRHFMYKLILDYIVHTRIKEEGTGEARTPINLSTKDEDNDTQTK